MRCWHGCKWFAYGSVDAIAIPSSLASFKSGIVLPFRCQVVLEKRSLNRCLSVCLSVCLKLSSIFASWHIDASVIYAVVSILRVRLSHWWCSSLEKPLFEVTDQFSNIFRSTPLSRPNNIRGGLKCPSVGTSVYPSVHTYVRASTKSFSEVNVTGLLKFQKLHFEDLSPPPFTMGARKWPLILKLEHNI